MKNYPLNDVRKITSIKDMVKQSVAIYNKKPAFLVKDKVGGEYRPVSFNDMYHDVNSLGTFFADKGFTGKKIAVVGENRYEWAISYLAAVLGNSTIVPLDKELAAEDLANLVDKADVSCIVYSKRLSKKALEIKEKASSDLTLINMDLDEDNETELSYKLAMKAGRNLIREGNDIFETFEPDVEAPQILLFTSGTTALSKAVMLCQRNICTNLMAMCQSTYIDDKDVFLSILPLHHTYECTCGFLCAIYRGCTIAYCEGLKYIQKNLKESKATMMLGVPAVFEAMYKRIWSAAEKNGITKKLKMGMKISNALRAIKIDLRRQIFKQVFENFGGNLRLFVSGAAAINPEVSVGFRNMGIEFIQGYGITECSPIVALNRDYYYKDAAAGIALPGLEIKIIDKDEDGIGEIVCKGDNVMLGYYKDEEETAKTFVDGWFKTGDLGYIDEDGFVFITGRKKNLIVTKNGKNIFPEELETFINGSPYVAESMVYGEENPDDGETYLCASVYPNHEYIKQTFGDDVSDEKIKEVIDAVIKDVNDRNPLYKYIRNVDIRDKEFIKTTTNKIKRYMNK